MRKWERSGSNFSMNSSVQAQRLRCSLIKPITVAERYTKEMRAAAKSLGVELHVLNASTERELDTAFESLTKLRVGGLVIGADLFFTNRIERLAALTMHHAI